ncbi:MAG TPA: ABC transporter substrate binding protein, partial [bacterium]|nr:ABC transporter substrate binding protein [bacterium]
MKYVGILCCLLALLLAGCSQAPAHGPAAGPKKIVLITLSDIGIAAGADSVILQTLRESGLQADSDFILTCQSAQGELAALPMLVDNAVATGADMLIPLQQQTLQACLARKVTLPVVFHLVAEPVSLGVGESDTVHLANYTGAYLIPPEIAFDGFVKLLLATKPAYRTLGTLYTPALPSSVTYRDGLTASAAKCGVAVTAVPLDDRAGIIPAIDALLARRPDAIVLVSGTPLDDNTGLLMQRADAAGIPVIGTIPDHIRTGAALVMCVDHAEGSRAVGRMVARILRGESPGVIPLFV